VSYPFKQINKCINGTALDKIYVAFFFNAQAKFFTQKRTEEYLSMV